MQKFVFTSSKCTTIEGKTFDDIDSAKKFMAEIAHHSKVHLDGKLISVNATETSLSFKVEENNPFLAMFGREPRTVVTYCVKAI